MQSKEFFRQLGEAHDEPARRCVARDAAFVVGAIAVLLALLSWGNAVDSAAQATAAQRAAGSFEGGLAAGKADMDATVAAAYRQGQLDALALAHARAADYSAPAAPEPQPQARPQRMVLAVGQGQ